MLPTKSESHSPKVFLSYSSKDAPAATAIRESLMERGLDVWSSEDIQPGDNIPASIQQEINAADDVLILISSSSEDNPWVEYEAAAALAARESGEGKRIIPVLLDSRSKPPPILSRFNYLDLSKEGRWANELDRLAKTVGRGRAQMTAEEEDSLEIQRLKAEQLVLDRMRVDHEIRSLRRELYLRLALGLAVIASLFVGVLSVILGFVGIRSPLAAVLGAAVGVVATLVSRSWILWSSEER